MNNEPLLSVIVPVYKAEDFLERCVESIRNQSYSNLEIILVDDGSPDSCGRMCDDYRESDPRIKVIHKENGGQSSARNAGLDAATGELIGFVDSDDWIKPNMFSFLYDNMLKSNADISCCGIEIVNDEGVYGYMHQNLQAYFEFDKAEAFDELLDNQLITFSVYNKLYRHSVIENIRFTEGMIYEDGIFAEDVLETCNSIVCSGEPLYCYYVASESTTRGRVSLKQVVDIVRANHIRLAFYEQHAPASYSKAVNLYIKDLLDVLAASVDYDEYREERQKLRRELIKYLPKAPSTEFINSHRNDIAALKLGLRAFDIKRRMRG